MKSVLVKCNMAVERRAVYARRRTIGLVVLTILCGLGLWHSGRLAIISKPIPTSPPRLDLLVIQQPVISETQGIIRSGEVISTVLQRLAVEPETSARLTVEIRDTFDLARIHSGRPLTVWHRDGNFYRLHYEIDPDRFLKVYRTRDGKFQAALGQQPFHWKRESIQIRIVSSLYEAILEGGERPELADSLATLFECSTDFNRDIQPQDQIKVWIEKKVRPNGDFQYGDILAAELINNGRTTRVLRVLFDDGRKGYFHPDGKSVRTLFLRSPLPFMRVTSRFGMRNHPIFGYSAKHNGIDLGAPTGTSVRSTAAGTILQCGFDRARGRFIVARHPNGYATHYYHLNGIKSGIRAGIRVQQGEVIGFVGSTGWSNGPHLHYGVVRNGRFQNPLRIDSPREPSLPASLMPQLRQAEQAAQTLFLPASPLRSPLPAPTIPSLTGHLRGR